MAGRSAEITLYPPADGCVLAQDLYYGDAAAPSRWAGDECADEPLRRRHTYLDAGRILVVGIQGLESGQTVRAEAWLSVQ